MSTIVLRSVKGSPLSNAEVDSNFTNLNNDKTELGGTYSAGTANGVLFLSASKVLTTGSALTFDGTNLGIGTSSPFAKLVVAASTGGIGMEVVPNGSDGGTLVEYYNRGTAAYTPFRQIASYHRFDVGVSEQMRLTSTGLGIGTTSPGAKLGVLSADGATTSIVAGATGKLRTFGYADATRGALLDSINTAENTYLPLTLNGSSLLLQTGATTRATLDSSGNLGIGTSSPIIALSVNKTSDTTFTNLPANILSYDTTAMAAGVGGGLWFGGKFNSGNDFQTVFAAISGVKENGTSGNTAGTLVFGVRDSGGGVSIERMRLDSSGNLGLGVTPSAWQSIYRVFQAPGGSSFVGRNDGGIETIATANSYRDSGGTWRYFGTGVAMRYAQSSDGHTFFTAPSGTAGNAISFSQVMTLTAAGRLGVGQTSPGVAFSVAGQSESWQIAFTTVAGTAGGLIGSPAADVIAFGNWTGSERARITAAGELLVGLTSATGVAKLQVSGAIRTTGFTVATLPAGTVGMRTYVTDALAPSFGVAVAGSGAVTIPVFYDGANWIVA
jgi:hypothetical protein